LFLPARKGAKMQVTVQIEDLMNEVIAKRVMTKGLAESVVRKDVEGIVSNARCLSDIRYDFLWFKLATKSMLRKAGI
jgi:hypothetical protein